MSASGDTFYPLLLCSNPAALSIFHMAIRDGIDLRKKIQPSRDLNKELFLEYVREYVLLQLKATMSFQDIEEACNFIWCQPLMSLLG
jgi:hypothetical protein